MSNLKALTVLVDDGDVSGPSKVMVWSTVEVFVHYGKYW